MSINYGTVLKVVGGWIYCFHDGDIMRSTVFVPEPAVGIKVSGGDILDTGFVRV